MDAFVYAVIALGAILLALIAVILIRTLRFKPHAEPQPLADSVEFDKDGAIEALRALVRCKTISYRDPALEDEAEFEKFVSLLPTLYPEVYKVCTLTRFCGRGLLFKWEGVTHDSPAVMMSHYDVVPINESEWTHPPFDAELLDGVIYGRGTLDTKVTLNAVLYAANTLIASGYTPKSDIYFAFSGSEEISGCGMPEIVSYFVKEGIGIGLVLDEGGAVVEGAFPGVSCPTAMIGIAVRASLILNTA